MVQRHIAPGAVRGTGYGGPIRTGPNQRATPGAAYDAKPTRGAAHDAKPTCDARRTTPAVATANAEHQLRTPTPTRSQARPEAGRQPRPEANPRPYAGRPPEANPDPKPTPIRRAVGGRRSPVAGEIGRAS